MSPPDLQLPLPAGPAALSVGRKPAAQHARDLGVSVEAVELCRATDLIDLHIDTFIPPRLWGYDPRARHDGWILGRHFFGHLDLPRMRDAGLSGAMWSITTNPFRSADARWRTFQTNLERLGALVRASAGQLMLAPTHAAYAAARAAGAHAVMVSVQGANAWEAAPRGAATLAEDSVVRATLVHLTSSCYGATSSPHSLLRRDKGLTPAGVALVQQLNAQRVFVDLAHIHPAAFWGAVAAHDRSQPLLATHTGVTGARPHWRNLDDAQLRAIAETGGVVGVIFATNFLSRPGGPRDARMVLEHMEHIIRVIGEDHVAVGSDYDGAISPPAELGSGDRYPVLVQRMMDAGWSTSRVEKVLGQNFLRCFAALRPGTAGAAAPG